VAIDTKLLIDDIESFLEDTKQKQEEIESVRPVIEHIKNILLQHLNK
jgi:Ethanolamine utilization protein EutJ (predicted chaperonin)